MLQPLVAEVKGTVIEASEIQVEVEDPSGVDGVVFELQNHQIDRENALQIVEIGASGGV